MVWSAIMEQLKALKQSISVMKALFWWEMRPESARMMTVGMGAYLNVFQVHVDMAKSIPSE